MTDTTIPLQRYKGWEPTTEGVRVHLGLPAGAEVDTELNLIEVRELRDDMEEANMLSRGYEKVECNADKVQHLDLIVVLGKPILVDSVLEEKEDRWVLQNNDGSEVILNGYEVVTVWRVTE